MKAVLLHDIESQISAATELLARGGKNRNQTDGKNCGSSTNFKYFITMAKIRHLDLGNNTRKH